MKITEITPAQAARFEEWSKKWIEVGLSTEPADFDSATEAALKAYKLCNLHKPQIILRMGSPFTATVGGAMAWMFLKKADDQVSNQVFGQMFGQVREQVFGQVCNQVSDQVIDQVSGLGC